MLRRSVLILTAVLAAFCQTPYQKPPKEVLDVLNAPVPPVLAVNPASTHALHPGSAWAAANLLAHCDLFRAGIARSGAHNRTLTPFGFQSERRTL